jgi:hypothetical protein
LVTIGKSLTNPQGKPEDPIAENVWASEKARYQRLLAAALPRYAEA